MQCDVSRVCDGALGNAHRRLHKPVRRISRQRPRQAPDDGTGQETKIAGAVHQGLDCTRQDAFSRDCTECHGGDGKSLVDVVANATDLTDPKAWQSGTSEGEVFRSIRDGAGEAMPPFSEKLTKEEDLWHLVNFLRSLWPESARPKLAEGAPAK